MHLEADLHIRLILYRHLHLLPHQVHMFLSKRLSQPQNYCYLQELLLGCKCKDFPKDHLMYLLAMVAIQQRLDSYMGSEEGFYSELHLQGKLFLNKLYIFGVELRNLAFNRTK